MLGPSSLGCPCTRDPNSSDRLRIYRQGRHHHRHQPRALRLPRPLASAARVRGVGVPGIHVEHVDISALPLLNTDLETSCPSSRPTSRRPARRRGHPRPHLRRRLLPLWLATPEQNYSIASNCCPPAPPHSLISTLFSCQVLSDCSSHVSISQIGTLLLLHQLKYRVSISGEYILATKQGEPLL
ncbi:uncharacterized protein LOC123401523 [Hordeum vulgare subsp. vulgare]|uniref:Predicted protein n=1 Tax=Hordeum vulgare subsp. vulgare TaxID=112509 RepID=F2EDQ8_HORVV|nr:uncharacterized protein LOC123401523 [Hordeum vulgare subsp. vulgare]BAK05480.1 predicted protein [Hordeum vulgare subsp. vulgare]